MWNLRNAIASGAFRGSNDVVVLESLSQCLYSSSLNYEHSGVLSELPWFNTGTLSTLGWKYCMWNIHCAQKEVFGTNPRKNLSWFCKNFWVVSAEFNETTSLKRIYREPKVVILWHHSKETFSESLFFTSYCLYFLGFLHVHRKRTTLGFSLKQEKEQSMWPVKGI